MYKISQCACLPRSLYREILISPARVAHGSLRGWGFLMRMHKIRHFTVRVDVCKRNFSLSSSSSYSLRNAAACAYPQIISLIVCLIEIVFSFQGRDAARARSCNWRLSSRQRQRNARDSRAAAGGQKHTYKRTHIHTHFATLCATRVFMCHRHSMYFSFLVFSFSRVLSCGVVRRGGGWRRDGPTDMMRTTRCTGDAQRKHVCVSNADVLLGL